MDRHTPTREQKINSLFGLKDSKPTCIEEGFETIIDGHIMSESDLRLIRRALIHYYTRIDIQTATQKAEEKRRVAYLGQTIGAHLDLNEYFRCKNTMTEEEMEEHYRRKNNASEEKN
tara:strand:+ start:3397 stop:3747 length:351 start_codon:yes stop_codon:yes gene_type:complete